MQIDIRKLRHRMGNIPQGELARRLGVDQSTVSRLEARGEAEGPVAVLLERLDKEAPPASAVEAAE